MIRNNYTAVDYKAISGMKEMIPEIISGLAVSYSEYDKEKDEWRGFIECNSGKLCLTAIGDEENETNEYLKAIIADLYQLIDAEETKMAWGIGMKPSEKCKAAGLKGLAELVEITGKCRRTLINWNSASPLLFEIVLRGAVATKEMSAWTEIDYDDPSTYPEENRPCIVAWENHPEHPDRYAMHVFNDVGDDMRLWQNAIGDEVHDWDGTLENPTHWMYAPEYQP